MGKLASVVGAEECDEIVSPIRWAGSKRRLLPTLASYWNTSHRRYIEPFCGSCALYFLLRPREALLSDANPELVHFLVTMQSSASEVWMHAVGIPRQKKQFLELRSQNPSDLDRIARAARFLFLNRNCFNGLYRTDRNGHFNVPFSALRTGELPTLADFLRSAERLSRAKIVLSDFGRTLARVRSGDFVYLDPPYYVSSRRVFRDYGARVFSTADIERLAGHLERIDQKGASFLLSFADCSDIREVSRRWHTRRVRVHRQIGGFASTRRTSYDLLISNLKSLSPR